VKRYPLRLFFILSLVLLDLAALALSFQLAYWTRFIWPFFLSIFPATKGIPDIDLYHQALWALLPMWGVVFFYAGFYKDAMLSAYDEFILVLRGMILSSFLTMAMTFAYRGAEYSRLTIGLWTLYSVILIYLLRELDRALFQRLLFWISGPQQVLVVGKGKALEAIRQMTKRQPFFRTHFLETLPHQESLEKDLARQHISQVLLLQGAVSSQAILETAQLCEHLHIACKIVPDLLGMRRGEIIIDGFCGLPTFSIQSLSLYGTNYVLKRSFDILGSLMILAVSFIPLVLISILISVDNPGPVLYSQDRMGFLGRKFKLYKFRTMIIDADQHIEKLKHLSDRSGPVFKMRNDPRITRVGRWLRRFSLDEIPQILNVLKGDMSLVGPRPQVLWEAAHYDEHAKKRLRIKPGITGLWQVSGRAALSYEEMINLDIFYLENWSLGLDLKILLRTMPAVFAKEGSY
jgi:exopolysaccharide biosynthesis polyprenyl glycosylphosphotransferase